MIPIPIGFFQRVEVDEGWYFQTNIDVDTTTFDPGIISSDLASWELVDGTTYTDINLLSISSSVGLGVNELNGTIQNVKLSMDSETFDNVTYINLISDNIYGNFDFSPFSGSCNTLYIYNNPNLTSITNPTSSVNIAVYQAYNCDLTGALDLSTLTGFGGYFNVFGNSNLTSITNPVSSQVFTHYRAYNCNLTGTLDLSTLTGLGGFVFLHSNPNLTSVVNPVSSQVIPQYRVNNCDLTGTLDLSTLTGLGGLVYLYSNPNLTSIVNPVSSQVFSRYYAYNCDLTGTLDLSGLTGLGGLLFLYSNPNLTSIVNPVSSQVFSRYYAYNCDLGYIDFSTFTGTSDGILIQLQNNNMTVTEVNHILVDLDNNGWINGTLNISGTNAAPDGTSGGFDGITAKANLIANGWVVTTS